jgi:hypothetical protein
VKLLPHIASAASGRLGGISATPSRAGTTLRIRPTRVQPRSPSQTNSRAQLTSLNLAWQALPATQQAAWQAVALASLRTDSLGRKHALSGYALFLSCCRNLVTVGATVPPAPPSQPPSLPRIRSLSAQPVYSQPNPPQYLTGLNVIVDPYIPAPFYCVLRATAGVSAARSYFGASDFRVIAIFQPFPTYAIDAYNAWLSVWGQPPSTGMVWFEANLVDPTTGYAGPPLRCSANYLNPAPPLPIPGTVQIDQNGVPIAVIPGTVISFGGAPQAGG